MDITSYLLGKNAGGGGSITLQEKTLDVTENGTEIVTADSGYNGLSKVTVNTNVSSGEVEEKDVNFYDYDGTRLYSYTKNEFLALESLPTNPSHEGLTAQGWNWSYADAINFVTDYGMLDIGQMYITDDGDTRIYVSLDLRLDPYLGIALNGSATIDWGDNTTSNITGSSLSILQNTKHTYSTSGDYVIKIKPESGTTLAIFNVSGRGSSLIWKNATEITQNLTYNNMITKIELGTGITSIGEYAFHQCQNLKSITMPNTITSISNSCFYTCYKLKFLTMPNNLTTIADNAMYFNMSLSRISMSKSITSMGISCCNANFSVKKIIISASISLINNTSFFNNNNVEYIIVPASVTQINTNGFGIGGAKIILFPKHTSVPTLQTNGLNYIPTDCVIAVPDDLYDTWKTTAGWSSYSSQIVKASEV